ncbi:MAG: glycoside hydrolase family 6 protein [Solirubrobacteraceae bacterium]
MRSRHLTLLLLCLLMLAPAGAARAAAFDPLGFRLSAPLLFVNENAGHATVVVARSNTFQGAQIRYITIGVTAQAPYDYTPQKGMIDFSPGQAVGTFEVPIVDHGIAGLPKTIQVSLFGPSPIGLSVPAVAVLTILNNDPIGAVDASNPLGLPAAASRTNPLAGASFYVDHFNEAAHAARRHPALRAIADQPGAARFGSFSYPSASTAVARYLSKAAVLEPGTVPMLTTYRIVDGHCGHWSDPPADQASYHKWISAFAAGIGTFKAVLFLEQDALITTPCLTSQGVAVRMAELRDAIHVLSTYCPHVIIYLDAGAADALPAARAASLLRQAGVSQVAGFFLNATHFDWTSTEIRYGNQISQMTGGKHFVVSTGESGRGPLAPSNRVKYGNEVLCNPAGRGLGPRPTTSTGYPNVDAFAWLDNPGGSSGQCVPGAPPAGAYWPAYALSLVRNAVYAVH